MIREGLTLLVWTLEKAALKISPGEGKPLTLYVPLLFRCLKGVYVFVTLEKCFLLSILYLFKYLYFMFTVLEGALNNFTFSVKQKEAFNPISM